MLTWRLRSCGNPRLRKRVLLCLVIFGPCLLLGATVAEAQGEPSEKGFVEYRPSARVRVIPDLAYAKYGDRTLLLDLYLPSQLGQGRPGVIVVRGGGWMVNDRKRFAHVASALAEKGVAAACIEYRTAEEAAFPGAIQDVKAAVRWMRANAARYGIDSHAIGTLGGSSGAHMALLAGLTAGVAELEGNGGHEDVSSQIQAVVAMATPADLLSLSANNKRTVGTFLHVTPEQDAEMWRWASPVNHVTAGGPPVLLLHGTADDSVPSTQSVDFARRYREAGASAEVELLPGAPHAFWNYRPWFSEAIDRAATFFLRVAKKGLR
ncbi:MAG: alpha/beta hydrolase [Verrucomicrobia bacterium]|nr:MAG: alpha/beta hydrolase [Verrucomicrobiota bacterium]